MIIYEEVDLLSWNDHFSSEPTKWIAYKHSTFKMFKIR